MKSERGGGRNRSEGVGKEKIEQTAPCICPLGLVPGPALPALPPVAASTVCAFDEDKAMDVGGVRNEWVWEGQWVREWKECERGSGDR